MYDFLFFYILIYLLYNKNIKTYIILTWDVTIVLKQQMKV